MRGLLRDGPLLGMMVMQLVIWAALYYSFPASILYWQAEFGWRISQIMGAFTLAIAISALGAPVIGRLIDRGLSPYIFPLGALVGAGLLVGLTQVETLGGFYLIWGLIGLCMSVTLYEPCFALVTRARGAQARGSITAITLLAGFASTLAYPLIYALSEPFGWRVAIWAMAGLVMVVNLPLSLYSVRKIEAEARVRPHNVQTSSTPPAAPKSLMRDRRYWLIAGSFAAATFTTGVFINLLLPLMAAQGVPSGLSILAASVIGPSQVLGRVLMMGPGARLSSVHVAQLAMCAMALGAGLFAFSGQLVFLALVFAVAQGVGHGVLGIIRAVVTRDHLGEVNYGAIAGAVALPSLMVSALAPIFGAVALDQTGALPVIALCLIAPVLGIFGLNQVSKAR